MVKKSSIDLRMQIQAFKASDLSTLSYEQVMKRVERIMDQYAVTPVDVIFNKEMYRARINPDGQEFTHAKQLWYRTERVEEIPIGRFNKAGESLFYASCEMHEAIFELQPKKDDIVTVMMVAPVDKVAKISVTLTGLSKSPKWENVLKERLKRSIMPTSGKKWLIVDNFLEEILTEVVPKSERYKYQTTAAIAELLLKIPGVDAIQYPGIATSLKGLNLCLKRESVDRVLKPIGFSMMKVVDIVRDQESKLLYGVEPIKSASVGNNGEILWGVNK